MIILSAFGNTDIGAVLINYIQTPCFNFTLPTGMTIRILITKMAAGCLPWN